MNTIPPTLRRFLALSLLVVALSLSWQWVIAPAFSATKSAVETLNDARFELHRLNQLAQDAEKPESKTLDNDTQELTNRLFSIQGADSGAAVVATADQLIRGEGLQLLQLRALPSTRAGSLTRYAVEVQATAKESSAVQLLSKLEQHRPVLLVERALLTAQAAPSPEEEPQVTVELRIAGFVGDLTVAHQAGTNAR